MFIEGPILGLRLVNFKLHKRERRTDQERERPKKKRKRGCGKEYNS